MKSAQELHEQYLMTLRPVKINSQGFHVGYGGRE